MVRHVCSKCGGVWYSNINDDIDCPRASCRKYYASVEKTSLDSHTDKAQVEVDDDFDEFLKDLTNKSKVETYQEVVDHAIHTARLNDRKDKKKFEF